MIDLFNNDIEAWFNLQLVQHRARPAFLLEMQNDVRKQYNMVEYLDAITTEFPDLFYQQIGIYRVLISSTELPTFIDGLEESDILLAEYLDFDCKGIDYGEGGYYVLNYYINGVPFYTAICPDESLFARKARRLEDFQQVADLFGMEVTMSIDFVNPFGVDAVMGNLDYWINNQDEFFSQLEGYGIEYLSGYNLEDLVQNHRPLLLFTLARTEVEPIAGYFPLNSSKVNDVIREENKIFNPKKVKNPFQAYEKFEKQVVRKTLGITEEYLDAKEELFQLVDKYLYKYN